MIDFLIPVARAAETASSGGVAGTLGLNVTYFIGQLVTFGLVLLILWKFVFNPVASALEARTAKIEKSLNDADRITKEKQEFEVWKNGEMVKARQEASSIITSAQTEAGQVKNQILQDAKSEQQKLVDQAKKQILDEKQATLTSAKSELADLVTAATEKVIRKKLDVKADQELIIESLHNVH